MRPFLFFLGLLHTIPASAQRPQFGIQAGVPLTTFFIPGSEGNRLCGCSAVYTPATKRFTIGPSVEFDVWRSWSLESGFLYKRVNYNLKSDAFFIPRVESAGNTSGNSWEIPLLARRRLRLGPWEASLGAGPVVRMLGQLRQQYWETSRDFFGAVTLRRLRLNDPPEFGKRVYPGLAVSARATVKLGAWRIGPEFRYTRWLAHADPSGYPPLQFQANQAELLLGLRF